MIARTMRFKLGSLLVIAVVVIGWMALRNFSSVAASPKPTAVSGAATVSGTVTASGPFKAARVFLRNMDKGMLYMVYTSSGRFEAVELFPGNYEMTVQTKGLESDVQKLTLKPGEKAMANVTLHDQPASTSKVANVPYD